MGGLSLLEIQYMYSDFNLVLKSELDEFKEIYNKPKTIFLAHVRKMHWVCFSNIYMPNTTKYQDNGYYVIYDCFNKAAKDCKTKDIWLGAFDLYIKKLFPQWKFENKIIFLIIIIFQNLFIITLSFLNQTHRVKY